MGVKLTRLVAVLAGTVLGYALGEKLFMWFLPPKELRFVNLFGLAIAGGMSGYLAGPKLFSELKEFNAWLDEMVKSLAVPSLIGGAVGAALGLAMANLILFPILLVMGTDLSSAPLAGLVFVVNLFVCYVSAFVGARFQSQKSSRKEEPLAKPKVLDTSVLIDGRIADIARTHFLEGRLIIPNFIVQELRFIADSQEPLRRSKGRRGLDVLRTLQQDFGNRVSIASVDWDKDLPVDDQLMRYAKNTQSVIITNDYNLNKHASVAGVPVLNINDLANAVKSVVMPGEELNIQIIKEGKESEQGVGYLADGTMVIVEDAKRKIGKTVDVSVTNVLQTPAGRVIFARMKNATAGRYSS